MKDQYWIARSTQNSNRHLHADPECLHLRQSDVDRAKDRHIQELERCTTCTEREPEEPRQEPIRLPEGTCPSCGSGRVYNEGPAGFYCFECDEKIPHGRLTDAIDGELSG